MLVKNAIGVYKERLHYFTQDVRVERKDLLLLCDTVPVEDFYHVREIKDEYTQAKKVNILI